MGIKPTYEELERRLHEFEKAELIRRGLTNIRANRTNSTPEYSNNIENIVFEDLFSFKEIQRLQDEFADATGVASIITNIDGTPITKPSNFCRLCIDIIRKTEKGLTNCFKSDSIIGRHHTEGPIIQPCMSGGLWDAGAGITVGGKHIANWLIGQVRDEKQTEKEMAMYAHDIGVDETTMINAYREVPSMSLEHFTKIANMLFTFANQLSKSAYQNLQKNQFINERIQAEYQLAKSEERYRDLVEASSDFIWEVDPSGIYTYVSPKVKSMLGYDPSEIIGKTRFDLMSSTEAERVRNEFGHFVEKRLPIVSLENENLHKNGEVVVMETSGVPIVSSSGELKGYRGIDRDVTLRKKTENELKEYQEHLEKLVEKRSIAIKKKNKELEMFTYSVSHDLKAPLRGIDGYSRLLEEEYSDKLDEEGLFFLNNVRQGTTQMNKLIEDLLAYSRTERKELHHTSIDLKSLIENLVGQRTHDIEKCSINIKIDVPFQIVESDTETLRQVLTNYLDNAIKYSKKDTSGSVTIGGSQDDDYWTLWVKDSGIGFDPKYLDRIFEIFQRLHRVEEYPGTGVGLAIVRKAVERIGGRVRADSTPGKGSTFYLDIPKNNPIIS